MNKECSCKDWKQNIDNVNCGFSFMATHGGKGYSGKKFDYCPWCGKKLMKEKT